MAGIRSLIARLLFVGLVALAVQGAPSSRLQPCSMSAVGLLTLSFAYGAGDTGCSPTTPDNNGNILKQTITPTVASVGAFSQNYGYDALNRLSSVQETTTSWSRTYHYDAFGNRAMRGAVPTPAAAPLCAEDDPSLGCSTQAGTTADKPGFVPASNRLTADWASYDLAGNLLWYKDPLSSGARQWSAAYDANNKQSQFCAGASGPCTGTTATYEYDGQGNRIKKTTAARSTTFVYDAFGMLTAEYSTAPPTTAGGRFFRTTDHLGSTRLVTDHEGGCKVWQDFYPFGERILGDASAGRQGWNCYGGAGTDPFAQEFTAKERDTESNLDYFRARYYGSSLGRFLSPDGPFFDQHQGNPQSWNLYTYVRNAPTNFTDPSGTTCVVNADGSEETVDDGGETCEGIAVDNVLGGAEVTVVADPGPALNAFFINAFFGVNNLANDSFAFLFDQRPQSLTNIPLSRGAAGRTAGGTVLAGALVGSPKNFVQTVSRNIGRGHAFTKHVLTKGDLGGLIIGIGGQVKQIRTVDDLSQFVGHIITKAKGGDAKNLSRGRKAWWDSETGTVVIHDPNHPDLGTVFRPDDGRAFFDRLN